MSSGFLRYQHVHCAPSWRARDEAGLHAPLEWDTPLYRTADRPVRRGRSARRRSPRHRRAAALSRAGVHRQLPRAPRRRPSGCLPRLPRAALERARPDQGRRALRRRGEPRRVRRARRLDDLEMRVAAAALRRRQGWRALQAARDVQRRARATDPPLHVRAAADHRPAGGHPGAGHGDERADDGLDDGHVLDAARLRSPRRS